VRLTRALRDGAVLVLALGVAVLVQVTVAIDFQLLGGAPDVVCVVVVAAALVRGPEVGALCGFSGGFLLDALAAQPIGLSSLVLTSVGYAAGRFGARLPRKAAVRPLAAVGLFSVACRGGLILLGILLGSTTAGSEALSIAAVPNAALDVLIAIGILPLLRRLLRVPSEAPSPLATTTPPESAPPLVV
jgi:rod shape-determining protein MreD